MLLRPPRVVLMLAISITPLRTLASTPTRTFDLAPRAACTTVSPDPPGFLEGEQINWSAGFYEPGLGACGIVNTEDDFIVAMSHIVYDAYPGFTGTNCNPICNRPITVAFQGKSVQVTVTDDCLVCGSNEMQLSPAAFAQLADLSEGLIQVDWSWAD
ncbi:RlpA-like double-psi beta-barrel-protein domain-containing protein-containing protein [Lentinula raphanica]|nr:RlpA-like double-psi beta-barrel-protein domain-containing protein-containing protein [Lentinula raphanica]